jgi:hypothetical protein
MKNMEDVLKTKLIIEKMVLESLINKLALTHRDVLKQSEKVDKILNELTDIIGGFN